MRWLRRLLGMERPVVPNTDAQRYEAAVMCRFYVREIAKATIRATAAALSTPPAAQLPRWRSTTRDDHGPN